jgi:putative ubiquitin-RnfH superfamily antitoxin RatB of RatAB toxin-antitoxin module
VKVEVIRAWPRGFESRMVELAEGATVIDAIAASGFAMDGVVAHAVFGVRVDANAPLHDGDRLELLRPLLADPKDARRQRAAARKP